MLAVRTRRLAIADLARDALHVLQLVEGRRVAISSAPVRARREPHRESFSKIFIRMLLRVPAGQVGDELAREWNGAVVVTISTAKAAEELAPIFALVKLVRVI